MNKITTNTEQTNTETAALYSPYLDIPMQYSPGLNNNQTGKIRRALTIKIIARFNITSPTIIS